MENKTTYHLHFTFLLIYIAADERFCYCACMSTIKLQGCLSDKQSGNPIIRQIKVQTMNGRVYDPLTASFLSPDNYVQMPDYTHGFNRYAYALNNPLIYTDPDGEWVGVIVFAAIFYTSAMILGSTFEILVGLSEGKTMKESVNECAMFDLFGWELKDKNNSPPGTNTGRATYNYSGGENPTGNPLQNVNYSYDVESEDVTVAYEYIIAGGMTHVDIDPFNLSNGCVFGVAEMVARYFGVNASAQDYADAFYAKYPEYYGGGIHYSKFNQLFFSGDQTDYTPSFHETSTTDSYFGSFYGTSGNPGTKEGIIAALERDHPITLQVNSSRHNDEDHLVVVYGYREDITTGKIYLICSDPQPGLDDKLYLDFEEYKKAVVYSQEVTGIKRPELVDWSE